ncbi:iron-siderophore ABC transporter substrate-binding protein [Gordonia jinhuaensis]|uniref:ABC transporter substrate-binding protein n=1 Tax=Gordonia jinhuaensis TaxID=1517702 RepID=A0A916TC13_9ACTN|nr:ABC transporter substrate-binding protein [Gordonia jinhuaensis]GGB36871.1 ABC transporter substrate-binding protein [Gordonia jinhuaensis]
MLRISHKRSAFTILLVAILGVVVGCSSPDGHTAAATRAISLGGKTIHISDTPKRIVALGSQWADVSLSLGVTPVAYIDNVRMASGRESPWSGQRLAGVTRIDPAGDIVSQVAAARPDLILATGFGARPDILDKLNALAPTVTTVTGAQVDPWDKMVAALGTVLNRQHKASEVIRDVNATVAEEASQNPALRHSTYALAYMYSADQIQVMADPADGAAQLMSSFGPALSPTLLNVAKSQGQPRFPISTENVPYLDSDLLVIAFETPDLATQFERLPGYSTLPSVRHHAVARLTVADITGINLPTPLSIPYIVKLIDPALRHTAPGTQVK